EALKKAVRRITKFQPDFLIIALGLDTAKGDPTGTWNLTKNDFEENGRMLGALRMATVIVQEGGYDSRVLGINARKFFTGLWSGSHT
ncbi:MAG: histone deacetylase family protein, partial [Nitrospiraceae bacterium]